MPASRRRALLALIALCAWFGCTLGFWALRPLDDSVPVGIDYNLQPAAPVSVTVKCNNLFDSAARDTRPLPDLKAQPENSPPLAFQRNPCSLPHRQARLVFALDTVGFIAAIGLGVWLLKPRRRQVLASDGPLIGSAAS